MTQFGTWIGSGAAGTWTPGIAPGLVADSRFPMLVAAASDGIDLSGAVALVTGAGSLTSIGARLATNLARGGARVLVADILPLTTITVTATVLAAEAGAGSLRPVHLDQGDLADIDDLYATLDAEGLRLTHLYPLAVVNRPRQIIGIRATDYGAIFAVNTFGVYHLVIRHMRQTPSDRPFYVCLPLSPNDGRLAGSGLYAPSKQALRPLVVQGQHEFGDRRGGIYTGLDIAWTRSALMAALDDGIERARAAGLITFEPQDTADCLTLLGTPAAAAIRGTVLDAGGNFGTTTPATFDGILRGPDGY